MRITKISAGYERTKNLGDFNSMELSAQVWAKLEEGENTSKAFDLAYHEVKSNLKAQAKNFGLTFDEFMVEELPELLDFQDEEYVPEQLEGYTPHIFAAGYSRKFNLGNYESVKISGDLWGEIDPDEDFDGCMVIAFSELRRHLHRQVRKLSKPAMPVAGDLVEMFMGQPVEH